MNAASHLDNAVIWKIKSQVELPWKLVLLAILVASVDLHMQVAKESLKE